MLVNTLILLCAGAIFSLAFPPLGLWVVLPALPLLFAMCAQSANARQSFWYGAAFGLGFFSLHILWLPQSFAAIYNNAFWLIYPPMLLVLAPMWGLVTWLSRLLGGRGMLTLALLPPLWVLMEWARSQGAFAFPWGQLGYVWIGTPLAQLADLQGVYGLSLMTSALASLLSAPFVRPAQRDYALARQRPFNWLPIVLATVLVMVGFGYSSQRVQQLSRWLIADEQALLVQGNPDPIRRSQGIIDEFTIYNRLTRLATQALETSKDNHDAPHDRAIQQNAAPLDVVVWPEGAIFQGQVRIQGERGQEARELLMESTGGAMLITGATNIHPDNLDANENYAPTMPDYNSVFSIEAGEVTDSYDKVVLVPFGERFFLLQRLRPLYNYVFRRLGISNQFGRGAGEIIKPLHTQQGDFGVYICYESVFPRLPRLMTAQGAEVLVNISNDSWFSHGNGAAQHFLMGSLRAIETRRYLLRVGHDGITGLVNPLGQVETQLPRTVADSLHVSYARLDGITPYVRYGDAWLLITVIYVALLGTVGLLRRSE